MKGIVVSILVLLAFALAAGWIYLRRFERSQLYRPSAEVAATPGDFHLRFQDVTFLSADGTTLAGWWIPANRPCATVVYCKGNAGNVGAVARFAPEFVRRGFNVFMWDYRGYGRSAGRPSERGLYADARAAYDAAEKLAPDFPLLAYGVSLGGAVAVQLAMDRPVAGLVLESSFSSAADLARRRYPNLPLHRLLSVSYDSASKAALLEGVPKLIGHAMRDEVVPFQSGRILHGAAADPKTFALVEGRHGECSWFVPGEPGNAELEEFLGRFKP